MLIEVFGAGCAKCNKLKENAEKAVKEADVDAEVKHVTDITEIMKRGIPITPALAVDGKIVSAGKVPSVEKIKQLLMGERK